MREVWSDGGHRNRRSTSALAEAVAASGSVRATCKLALGGRLFHAPLLRERLRGCEEADSGLMRELYKEVRK